MYEAFENLGKAWDELKAVIKEQFIKDFGFIFRFFKEIKERINE